MLSAFESAGSSSSDRRTSTSFSMSGSRGRTHGRLVGLGSFSMALLERVSKCFESCLKTSVDVNGDLGGGMAEQALRRFVGCTRRECQGTRHVEQIVEDQIWDADPLDDPRARHGSLACRPSSAEGGLSRATGAQRGRESLPRLQSCPGTGDSSSQSSAPADAGQLSGMEGHLATTKVSGRNYRKAQRATGSIDSRFSRTALFTPSLPAIQNRRTRRLSLRVFARTRE